MKIYIPTYNRASTISTNKLFLDSNFDCRIVVHNDQQLIEYVNGGVKRGDIEVSGCPLGIANQRNWILNELVEDGEWAIFADDNIKGFNIFPEPYYNHKTLPKERKELRVLLESHYPHVDRLEEVINQTIAKAEEIGANFCGFATIENYYFRCKKWKEVSMICTKFAIIKKNHLRFDPWLSTMDDYGMAALQLKEHGKVLVNSYVWPNAIHNAPGGIGTLKERGNKKVKDCAYLFDKYPGLFRYKERKNSLPMGEICLRGYSQSFIEKWRSANGTN